MSDSVLTEVIEPPTRDLGDGFQVRRALPSVACKSVGPFVFFDHFGPASFPAGSGLDVRPHPHIGLATVTYLFDGEIEHRDSLGSAQLIRPGEVNWMIAGRGIVHSERSSAAARSAPALLAGIQTWVALPEDQEQRPASFAHHGVAHLPLIEHSGRRIRLIAGSLYGERAPVATLSPLGYADVELEAAAELVFEAEFEQRAIYVVAGNIELAGRRFGAARLLLLRAHERATLRALADSRLMLFAGEPLQGPRYVWWNFVSSSRERIEQAKSMWREGRFDTVPGDEQEFIPLPAEGPPSGTPL